MRVEIAWWDLDGTTATIDSLREHLRDGAAEAWAAVEGLRLKFWMADRDGNRWGAVMLWEGERPAEIPPNRAAELIGHPADHRLGFDIEAAVEGAYTVEALHGLGPVFAALSPAPAAGERAAGPAGPAGGPDGRARDAAGGRHP